MESRKAVPLLIPRWGGTRSWSSPVQDASENPGSESNWAIKTSDDHVHSFSS